MNPILLSLLTLGLLFALVVPVALWFAWAASILWGWFVVPTFGAPPLSVLQMWGITLTLSAMRPKLNFDKEAEEKNWGAGITAILIGPPLSLGLGYAIKFWWM